MLHKDNLINKDNVPDKDNALDKDNVWIIIPAYNEEQNIGNVIEECKKYSKNILVVDDGSNDNTYNIAKKKKVKILRHIVNLGKGCALKTGCDYAVNKGAAKIVLIDADGQHEPSMIPLFLSKLEEHDIVFGIRRFNKNMPFVMMIGNNFINFIIKLLFNVNIRDSQSGYRAFNAAIYKKIRWLAQDYSMESEMIANVGKNRLKYTQVTIPTIYNDDYKGTTVIDGVKIVYYLFKWWFIRWLKAF